MSSLIVRACDKSLKHSMAMPSGGDQGQLHGCGQKQGQPITAVTSKDNQGMAVVFGVVARQLPTHLIANAVPSAFGPPSSNAPDSSQLCSA